MFAHVVAERLPGHSLRRMADQVFPFNLVRMATQCKATPQCRDQERTRTLYARQLRSQTLRSQGRPRIRSHVNDSNIGPDLSQSRSRARADSRRAPRSPHCGRRPGSGPTCAACTRRRAAQRKQHGIDLPVERGYATLRQGFSTKATWIPTRLSNSTRLSMLKRSILPRMRSLTRG